MSEKRTTIYDIANRLGISTATVNRALTGKPRVKEETRAMVIKTAKEMGFKTNTVARSLARRRIKLAVLGFTSFPEFHGPFLSGARDAGKELQDYNIELTCFSYDEGASNTPESDVFLEETLQAIADGGYDGVLALARPSGLFRTLMERGVYVAAAIEDIAPEDRRFYICYNGFAAGKIAAELIYRLMPDRSRPVAIASGWRGRGIHQQMEGGFREQMKRTPLDLCCISYNHDNPDIAYESTVRLLDARPELGAIYVNSFNSSGVIRAVKERGLAGKLLMITSDINRELRACISEGVVAASIFQNQYEQGRLGLRMLYECIANGETPGKVIAINPQIILSSNLDLF